MKKLSLFLFLGVFAGLTGAQAQELVTIEAEASAWIRNDSPDAPQDSTFMLIGQAPGDGGLERKFRGLLRFDLSDPSFEGKTITAADLNIFRRFNATSDPGEVTFSAYELNQPFISEIANSQGSQASWNNYTDLDAWNTPGADGIGTDRGDVVLATSVPFNEGIAGEVTAPGPQIKFNSTGALLDLLNANIGGSVAVILIIDGEGTLLNEGGTYGRFLWGIGGHNDDTVAQRPSLTVELSDAVTVEAEASAWIRNDSPDAPQDSTFMLIGQAPGDGGLERKFRGLLRFDLSDPSLAGKTVSNVNLNIYRRFNATSDPGEVTFSAYELNQPFISEIANSQGSQASWNNYTDLDAWNTPGADGIGTDRGNIVLATSIPFDEGNAGEVTAPGPLIPFTSTDAFISLVNQNIGGSVSVILIIDGEGTLLNEGGTYGRFLWGVGGHNDDAIAQRPTLSLEFGNVAFGPGDFSEYIVTDGWVDTGDWLGLVYVDTYPWVYVLDLGKYAYAGGSGWFYLNK
jgi:hypothetical protein